MNSPQIPTPKLSETVAATPPKTVSFGTLSDGRNEVIIEHQGLEYRLRKTRNGRLILNK